jgi:serine/threonine protein kinase
MPLGAGARLGPYEIVSVLGAGGMGEAYRARDSKHGRDIAVPRLARCADTHARPRADLCQDARGRYRHHILSAARSTSVVSRRIQYDTHSRS